MVSIAKNPTRRSRADRLRTFVSRLVRGQEDPKGRRLAYEPSSGQLVIEERGKRRPEVVPVKTLEGRGFF